jgi:hypothetical protein
VIDGAVGDCCKQDNKFVRVQCTINFAALITINPYPVTTKMQATYYIKLPQGARALINRNNQNYNLVTFLGAANLRTLTSHQVKMNILDPIQQDALVLLRASDFNLWSTNTKSNNISIKIDCKILKLAWHQICAFVFAEFVDGYTNQPQATLDHIKQCY